MAEKFIKKINQKEIYEEKLDIPILPYKSFFSRGISPRFLQERAN